MSLHAQGFGWRVLIAAITEMREKLVEHKAAVEDEKLSGGEGKEEVACVKDIADDVDNEEEKAAEG